MKNSFKKAKSGVFALILVLLAAPAMAADAIVHFKNGRAMRVLNHRTDGDWIYLILSEPKEPGKPAGKGVEPEKPEDLVRELGVLASTVDHIDEAKTSRGGPTVINPISRQANGVVRSAKSWDGTSPSRGYVVENRPISAEEQAKRLATNTEKRANTPTTQDGPVSKAEKDASSAALDEIDMSNTIAGGAMRAAYRNTKVPHYIQERAKQLQEQRRQEKAAKRLLAAQEAAAKQAGSQADDTTEPDR